MLLKVIFIGIAIVAFNVVIQGLGTIFYLRQIVPATKNKEDITNNKILKILISSFLFFTVIHAFQTQVWAFCYYFTPETSGQFSSLTEAVYFSMITFTTVGYGDVVLNSNWRILSGLEAINGIMLIGWTTAMMYSLIQNIYKKTHANQ